MAPLKVPNLWRIFMTLILIFYNFAANFIPYHRGRVADFPGQGIFVVPKLPIES